MKPRLLFLLNELRFSYWFVPSLMALGAIVLSIAAVTLDSFINPAFFEEAGWFYANRPDGARALLSTIAGSMITVAGVTFSITVAAVANSTNQFGPRLLTSFLKDRGNQITLGTFIATFLYCILVLRTVVGAAEAEASFVPNIALLIALVLALASIGVLIYFLHHVPQSVHVSHMIANTGRELIARIDKMFPDRIGEPGGGPCTPANLDDLMQRLDQGHPVPARQNGYVQQIDGEQLMSAAAMGDLTIRIECRPGRFVREQMPLVRIVSSYPPDDKLIRQINHAFTFDVKRSPTQDIMFLVDQLVEIAARALSPGINDPFTATNCLEWLCAATVELARRRSPDAARFDEAGKLRIVADPISFAEFCECAFASLRPYISTDRNAALHLMELFGSLATDLETSERREEIERHATAFKLACERNLEHPSDKAEIARLYATVMTRETAPAAASGFDAGAAAGRLGQPGYVQPDSHRSPQGRLSPR